MAHRWWATQAAFSGARSQPTCWFSDVHIRGRQIPRAISISFCRTRGSAAIPPPRPFGSVGRHVQAALKRHGITYPVAQDNDSATWNAWRNQYWPAQYIVDQHGNIVFSHAGEGQYDEIERTVRRLLNATS